MDLRAVKAATSPELVAAAVAAQRNAGDLLHDAEVLAQARSTARAYSLAALAVEEVGKGSWLATLATMPDALRARAPVGRMFHWHQLKQAAGQLVAVVPYPPPGLATRLVVMPADELAQALSALEAPADEADRLRRGGLYVDIGMGGRIREPAQITEAEVTRQLERARQAVGAARVTLGPELTSVAHPPEEKAEFARAAFDAFASAGYARTPDAAASVIVTMVSKLRERMLGIPQRDAPGRAPRGGNRARLPAG